MTERHRRRSRTITILDAIADPQLFGQHFRDHVTWAAWCVFLCALFGLPLTSKQLALQVHRPHHTTDNTTTRSLARVRRLAQLGLSRRQRDITPDLHSYLRSKAEGAR